MNYRKTTHWSQYWGQLGSHIGTMLESLWNVIKNR